MTAGLLTGRAPPRTSAARERLGTGDTAFLPRQEEEETGSALPEGPGSSGSAGGQTDRPPKLGIRPRRSAPQRPGGHRSLPWRPRDGNGRATDPPPARAAQTPAIPPAQPMAAIPPAQPMAAPRAEPAIGGRGPRRAGGRRKGESLGRGGADADWAMRARPCPASPPAAVRRERGRASPGETGTVSSVCFVSGVFVPPDPAVPRPT